MKLCGARCQSGKHSDETLPDCKKATARSASRKVYPRGFETGCSHAVSDVAKTRGYCLRSEDPVTEDSFTSDHNDINWVRAHPYRLYDDSIARHRHRHTTSKQAEKQQGDRLAKEQATEQVIQQFFVELKSPLEKE